MAGKAAGVGMGTGLDCGNVGQTRDALASVTAAWCVRIWADIGQYIISEQAIKCIKCLAGEQ